MPTPTPPAGTNISRIYYLERQMKNGFISRIEMRPRGVSYVATSDIVWVEIPKESVVSVNIKGFSWEDIPLGFADPSTCEVEIDLKVLIDISTDIANPDTNYKTAIDLLYRYILFPNIVVENSDNVMINCNVDGVTDPDLYGSNFSINVSYVADNGTNYSLAKDNFLDAKCTPKIDNNAIFYNTWIFSSTGRSDWQNGDNTWITTDSTERAVADRYTLPVSSLTGYNNKKPGYIEGIYSQKIQSDRKVDLFKSTEVVKISLTDSVTTTMEELDMFHLLFAIWGSHHYKPIGFDEWTLKRKHNPTIPRFGDGAVYPPVKIYEELEFTGGQSSCKYGEILDANGNLRKWDTHFYYLDGVAERFLPDYLITLDYFYEIFFLLINTYWIQHVMHSIDVKLSTELLPVYVSNDSSTSTFSKNSLFRSPYYYHNFSRSSETTLGTTDYPWYKAAGVTYKGSGPYFIYGSRRINKLGQDLEYTFGHPDYGIGSNNIPYLADGLLVNRGPNSLHKQYRNLLDFYKDNVEGAGCYGKIQYSPIFNFNGNGNTDLDGDYTSTYMYWAFFNSKVVAKDNSDFNPVNVFFDLADTSKCELTLSGNVISSSKSASKGYSSACNMEAFNREYKSKRSISDEEVNIKSITWNNLPTARLISFFGGSTDNKDQRSDQVIRKLYVYGSKTSPTPKEKNLYFLVQQTANLHCTTLHDTTKYGWGYIPEAHTFDWTKGSEDITGQIKTYQSKHGYAKALTEYIMSNYTYPSQYSADCETIWEPYNGEYSYLVSPRNAGIVFSLADQITGKLNDEIISIYGDLPTNAILLSSDLDTEKCIIKCKFWVPGSVITGEEPLK